MILIAALTLLLAVAGCGTSPTTTTRATKTPVAQAHGSLYVFASNQGPAGPTSFTVFALGLSDGKPVWHSQLSAVSGSAAIGGTTLYLGTEVQTSSSPLPQGTLEALNASTGALLWHHTPSSGFEEPVAASNDVVFADIVTFANPQTPFPPTQTLQALRASDGSPLWSSALNGSTVSNATVGSGTLYLVTSSEPTATATTPPTSTLVALDAGTGKLLWHLALQGPAYSAPVLSNGVLYLSELNSTSSPQTTSPTSLILAVQASDGMILWGHTTSPVTSTAGSIVVSNSTVCYNYFGVLANGPESGIVALHAADGSLSWQISTPQSGGPVSLAADSNTIYALESTTTKSQSAASVQTTLLAFDASSGKSLLTHPFPNLPVQAEFGGGSQPQVVGGMLYVVASSVPTAAGPATPSSTPVSIAVALRTHDGSLVWQRELTGNAEPIFFVAP